MVSVLAGRRSILAPAVVSTMPVRSPVPSQRQDRKRAAILRDVDVEIDALGHAHREGVARHGRDLASVYCDEFG